MGKKVDAIGFGLLVWMAAAIGGAAEISFRKYQVDPIFFSEGVAIGDVNRDGRNDVFAGDVWYETRATGGWVRHEFRKPIRAYDGSTGYSNSFANFSQDVNGDGWVDVIVVGFPGAPFHWYENPQGKPGPWPEHEIWRSACNETPIFADLFGTGTKGVVLGYQPEAQIGFFTARPDPTAIWEPLAISAPNSPGTFRFWHGLGVGDVNQDGREDVAINVGWWEHPPEPTAAAWTFHPWTLQPTDVAPQSLNRGIAFADIHIYDVDGDGDNDVLASSAHGYGVWWFERTGDGGEPQFVPHTIKDDVSQSHALHLVDIDGDGVKDLITGKRYFAHQGKDPGGREPALLYWLQTRRRNRGVDFVLHLIDDDSGMGTQFVVDDFDGDGLVDVVTSNKKGTHVFLQQR